MQTHEQAWGTLGASTSTSPSPGSKDGPFEVDFDTRVHRLDGEIVVTVLGEIDLATGPLLWECLATAIPDAERRLVIDLSGITFIDSTGMAVFMQAQKQLRHRGAELILRAPRASARRVLSITGLDTAIAVQDGSVTTTLAAPSPVTTPDSGRLASTPRETEADD